MERLSSWKNEKICEDCRLVQSTQNKTCAFCGGTIRFLSSLCRTKLKSSYKSESRFLISLFWTLPLSIVFSLIISSAIISLLKTDSGHIWLLWSVFFILIFFLNEFRKLKMINIRSLVRSKKLAHKLIPLLKLTPIVGMIHRIGDQTHQNRTIPYDILLDEKNIPLITQLETQTLELLVNDSPMQIAYPEKIYITADRAAIEESLSTSGITIDEEIIALNGKEIRDELNVGDQIEIRTTQSFESKDGFRENQYQQLTESVLIQKINS